MGKVVCTKCPNSNCGIYNDLSVETCECGTNLRGVPGVVVDTPILPELEGEIDIALPVYVQKCSACGTENFILDPDNPARVCCNCHRTRISSVSPSLFTVQEQTMEPVAQILVDKQAPGAAAVSEPASAGYYDDDDDDEEEVLHWANILDLPAEEKTVRPARPQAATAPPSSAARSSSPQTAARPAPANQLNGRTLVLTAQRYGSLTITLTYGMDNLPYLLGRSANHAQFFSKDPRVGNRHCELDFRNGNWYVREVKAQNGTAVNWAFLDIGGERMLHDGDELVLGHHPDSMAFRITIR